MRPFTFSQRIFRASRVLLITLLAFALAAAPLRSQDAPVSSLSPKTRAEVFNRVWRLVNDRYYDPALNGVNWKAVRDSYQPRIEAAGSDQEFYDLLEHMVAELRDAHTHVRNPFKRMLRDKTLTVSTGISFYEVEGKTVVTSVARDPETVRLGVEPGMALLAIDGRPVNERIAETQRLIGVSSSDRARRALTYSNLLDGMPDTKVSLTLIRTFGSLSVSDMSAFSITAERRVISTAPQVESRRLSSGFGYIQLTSWKSPAAEMFRAALETLKDAPGLIIDLRSNGGGHPKEVLSVGGWFFQRKTPFGSFIRRSGAPVELSAGRANGQLYSGPTVILVNEGSGSGSELFTAAMQENKRAVVVGEQTCGCVLAAEREKLPGGGEISLSVFGYVSSRGRRLEGSGVTPDRLVPLKLDDLRQRRDAVLIEAERILKEELSARSAAQSAK
jgi:carboxyl-terminal processing protease